MALTEFVGGKVQEMLVKRLAGRRQMTTHEFFQFFREYIYSAYDLMRFVTIEDFQWIQKHLVNKDFFKAANQMPEIEKWLSLMSDAREDVDKGVLVNLIKCIYGMGEVRANLVQESLDDTIEFLLIQIEDFVVKKPS